MGLSDTVAALRRVGIRNTGRPGTQATVTAGGQKVAILGFASYTWSDPLTDIAQAQRRVRQAARTAPIVIVTFHGGAEGSDKTHVPQGTETFLGENRGDLRRFTHAVIDAGADLVVGSGPHVMRGMELYKGRLVAYSMGNFAGYAVFSLGGVLSTSGVLQVTLNPDGTFRSGRLRPTQLVGEGTPAPGGDGVALVRSLSRPGLRVARAAHRRERRHPRPELGACREDPRARPPGADGPGPDRTVAFYAALGAREVRFGEGRRAVEIGGQRINLHTAGSEIAPHARVPRRPGRATSASSSTGTIDEALAVLVEPRDPGGARARSRAPAPRGRSSPSTSVTPTATSSSSPRSARDEGTSNRAHGSGGSRPALNRACGA